MDKGTSRVEKKLASRNMETYKIVSSIYCLRIVLSLLGSMFNLTPSVL